jgi:hypothetical protein
VSSEAEENKAIVRRFEEELATSQRRSLRGIEVG